MRTRHRSTRGRWSVFTAKWFTGLASLTAVSLVGTLVQAPQPDAAAGPLPVNTIAGVVRTPDGRPVDQALVTVELLPSGGYRSATGALAHVVATGVTDAVGAFSLAVPVTDDIAAEAAFHHGDVNFVVSAVKQPEAPHVFVPAARSASWPPSDASLRSSLDVQATCSTLLAPTVGADVTPTCTALGTSVALAQDCAAGNSVSYEGASTPATVAQAVVDEWLATVRAAAPLLVDLPDVQLPSPDLAVDLSVIENFVNKTTNQVREQAEGYVQGVYDVDVDPDALVATVQSALGDSTGDMPTSVEVLAAVEGLRAWLVGAAPEINPSSWLAAVDGLRDLVGADDIHPPSTDVWVDLSAAEALVAQTSADADQRVRDFLAESGDVDVNPHAALATVRSFLTGAVGDVTVPSEAEVRAELDALVQWAITVPPPVDPQPWMGALATAEALASAAARLAQDTAEAAVLAAVTEAGLTVQKVEALHAALATVAAERVAQITAMLGQVDLQRDVQTVRTFVASTITAQDPTPTVMAFVDSATDTAAFVRAQVLGLTPVLLDSTPLRQTAGDACGTVADAAAQVSRFAVGCIGGAAVGLHSSTFDFHDVEPSCYALGATVGTTVEAAVALAVACAENSDATCAGAKRAVVDAVGAAGAIAQACVDGGPLPLGALPLLSEPDEPLLALNCGATVALVRDTLLAAAQAAVDCVNFVSPTCANAKTQADRRTAEVKACVVGVDATAGAALPGPTASSCPTEAMLGVDAPLPTAGDLRDRVLEGAGAFYAQMQEQDGSVQGLALQPVNIGVLTVASEGERLGAPGLVTTPPDEPTDGSSGDTTTPLADTPSGSNATVLDDPGVVTPMVSAPSPIDESLSAAPAVTANKTTPPLLPEYPLPRPEKDEPPTPDERCKQPRYWETWIIDVRERGEFMEPVAEVHTSTDEWVDYTYEEEAETEIGVAFRAEKTSNWKVSGSLNMGNSSGYAVDLPRQKGTFSRHVLGEFGFVREWMTYCPYGYDGKSEVLHKERIRPLQWTGGLAYSSSDLSSRDDSLDDFKKAKAENRVGWGKAGCHIVRSKGKTYKYGASATAFGVVVTAQSTHNAKHKLKVDCGTTRQNYHFWGDKGYPANEANHAIYAYY